MSHHNQSHAVRKADFAERALAFTADYALFAWIWYLILKAVDPALPVFLNEKGTIVTIFLAALFLVYQAFFSCEGRVTFGKRLLGIRVAGADGEPLDLVRAIIRAVTYIPSSLFTIGDKSGAGVFLACKSSCGVPRPCGSLRVKTWNSVTPTA